MAAEDGSLQWLSNCRWIVELGSGELWALVGKQWVILIVAGRKCFLSQRWLEGRRLLGSDRWLSKSNAVTMGRAPNHKSVMGVAGSHLWVHRQTVENLCESTSQPLSSCCKLPQSLEISLLICLRLASALTISSSSSALLDVRWPWRRIEFQWFFYRIIGSSSETPGDGGPFVTVKLMGLNDGRVFQRGEWMMLHQGTELVAPSQAACLP
jgi:hypothetical protein